MTITSLPIRFDNATLPASYESARSALANCARIDECQDWADKAAALASYARQAEDETLLKMAQRIKARAIRREGELFKQIEPANGTRTDLKPKCGASPKLTRKSVAKSAGISPDQMKQAIRVANVPADEFEAAVESDTPPTITEIARAGTTRNIVDLEGRDPAHFNKAMMFVGDLRWFVEHFNKNHQDIPWVCSILTDKEKSKARKWLSMIDEITDVISTRL